MSLEYWLGSSKVQEVIAYDVGWKQAVQHPCNSLSGSVCVEASTLITIDVFGPKILL